MKRENEFGSGCFDSELLPEHRAGRSSSVSGNLGSKPQRGPKTLGWGWDIEVVRS